MGRQGRDMAWMAMIVPPLPGTSGPDPTRQAQGLEQHVVDVGFGSAIWLGGGGL